MSDLSERLRGDVCHTVVRECNAAADEIEAKAKRIELLEAVLEAVLESGWSQSIKVREAIAATEDKDDAG